MEPDADQLLKYEEDSLTEKQEPENMSQKRKKRRAAEVYPKGVSHPTKHMLTRTMMSCTGP